MSSLRVITNCGKQKIYPPLSFKNKRKTRKKTKPIMLQYTTSEVWLPYKREKKGLKTKKSFGLGAGETEGSGA